MCLLPVLLLGVLLYPGKGNGFQEEKIFTRPGSDLLIPIRHQLTLNHPFISYCDGFIWYYEILKQIAVHRKCDLDYLRDFLNIGISVNGSLIISNVTLEDDGRYSVAILNSEGYIIQEDYYIVHVEVPVSVPVLRVSCLRNGSAEISCRVEAGTKPNIHLSVIGGSQGKYSTSANNITAIVESPGPWNITCTARNSVSQSEESRAGVTCPGKSRSGWGNFLSSGAVFVLYTGLLIFIVKDLRKMKNEENRSERRKRRRDQVEMEMEPTDYNDCN